MKNKVRSIYKNRANKHRDILLNTTLSQLEKEIYEEEYEYYFDLSNVKKEIKSLTDINNELKVVLDNGETITFVNNEYVKISEIYKIKFTVLSDALSDG